ncbi:MAG: hypothetical protein O7C67_06655 [Gammaproteobacteria bacterium]|nr:hypothetical protein [Gammaproteobacteria bacterium]
MNRVLSLLTFCTALAACNTLNPVPAYSQNDVVSFDDVVLLAQSDISDQTIRTFLDFRELDFALDAGALLRLREAGVSEAVIRYLLEQDAASSTALPTDTVLTGYSAKGYPSYYYGSSRIGGTAAFPFGWYDHHYFGLGHTTIYRNAPHHNGGHSLGHAVGITHGHDGNIPHASSVLGGHRSSPGHSIRHTGSRPSHNIRHASSRLSHRARHRRGHTGRHAAGHSGGHSGGHGHVH